MANRPAYEQQLRHAVHLGTENSELAVPRPSRVKVRLVDAHAEHFEYLLRHRDALSTLTGNCGLEIDEIAALDDVDPVVTVQQHIEEALREHKIFRGCAYERAVLTALDRTLGLSWAQVLHCNGLQLGTRAVVCNAAQVGKHRATIARQSRRAVCLRVVRERGQALVSEKTVKDGQCFLQRHHVQVIRQRPGRGHMDDLGMIKAEARKRSCVCAQRVGILPQRVRVDHLTQELPRKHGISRSDGIFPQRHAYVLQDSRTEIADGGELGVFIEGGDARVLARLRLDQQRRIVRRLGRCLLGVPGVQYRLAAARHRQPRA